MTETDSHRVLVIGGGVVGICCALALLSEGYRVTLVDRNVPGDSAAAASCGSMALSEVIPLSRPGILRKAPGWLLSPQGPLTIRPGSMLRLLPWFLRFAANARPSRMLEISEGLAQLTSVAMADWEAFLQPLGLTGLIRDRPVLELYDSEKEFAVEAVYHARRRALGFSIDVISGQEAAEIEPAIARDFAKAVVFANWRSITDGAGFVIALTEAFSAAGGQLVQLEVSGMHRTAAVIDGVTTANGETIKADSIVLAAGAWSKRFAEDLGIQLSLEGIIGYQTTIANPGFSMEHGVVYARGGFGITPYDSGLAIGGTVEFADLDARPNWHRADILLQQAKRVLPGLRDEGGVRRMGRRPMTPDTLPIIDRVAGASNVLVATGHGQLGVTTAATTAKLIAALVSGRAPLLDLKPYRIDRFSSIS